MRIYVFKSETTRDLRAFTGDSAGTTLPKNHSPWTVTGVIAENKAPPHQLPRAAIEQAIDAEGFKLWRLRAKAKV